MVFEAFTYLLDLVIRWSSILVSPYKNFELLWIVAPALLCWIFNEFYQEKIGTSFGNVISNGAVLLWVGVDWARITTSFLGIDSLGIIIFKYSLAAVAVLYGLFVIIWGAKGHKSIKFVGRARNITYMIIMFTPLLYNAIPVDFETFLSIFLFFPIFYLVIEILDLIIPNPKIYDKDNLQESKTKAEEVVENSSFV
jgi:hypothetical protein